MPHAWPSFTAAQRLHSLHVRHHHATAQVRVFAHVLKVPAAQRSAIDVHTRTQNHVLAPIERFLAQTMAVEAAQFGIPCGGQTRQCRESHTRVVGLSGLTPLVPEHVGSHSVRSVVGPEIRYAQTLHAGARKLALSVDECNLLGQRHALHSVRDTCLCAFCLIEIDGSLCAQCGCAQEHCRKE